MAEQHVSKVPATRGNNFTFVRFYVNDIAASLVFYTEAFGLREVRRLAPPSVPATEIFLGSDDQGASLIDLNEINDLNREYIVGKQASAGSAVYCIEVMDVPGTITRAVALGGKVLMEGSREEWPEATFTWALLDDPDGNHVEVINYE